MPVRSGCINHPGIEAVGRCKQCGKPICSACIVGGPTGNFCSPGCKERHEQFIRRAKEIDEKSRNTGFFYRLKYRLVKVLVFLLGFVAIGFVSLYFNVPVLGKLFKKLLALVAPHLPIAIPTEWLY